MAGPPVPLVDTGGWLPGGDDLDAKVSAQSERAIAEADVVLLVVDAVVGVTEEDAEVGRLLRRPASRAARGQQGRQQPARPRSGSCWRSAWASPTRSAPSTAGAPATCSTRWSALLPRTPPRPRPVRRRRASRRRRRGGERRRDDGVAAVAIVGRPNVGKSTLFNRLIGEDRAVVHDLPGHHPRHHRHRRRHPDGPIRFVDTAGMRRKSRIDEGTEYYSLVRALQAVDEADVALLVIDATEGVTDQDQRLAERIDAAGCPVVVLLNKWELLDAERRADVRWQVGDKLHFIGDAPVLQGQRAHGQGRAQAAAGAGRRHRRLPPAHPHQPGERRAP